MSNFSLQINVGQQLYSQCLCVFFRSQFQRHFRVITDFSCLGVHARNLFFCSKVLILCKIGAIVEMGCARHVSEGPFVVNSRCSLVWNKWDCLSPDLGCFFVRGLSLHLPILPAEVLLKMHSIEWWRCIFILCSKLEIKLLQLKSVTAKKQRISDEFNDKIANHVYRLKSKYNRSP
jgi:hypothetical protein